MPKLIPLSSKKMKEMGIVKTNNGFMVDIKIPKVNKKEVIKNESQGKTSSKESKSSKEKVKSKPSIQRVMVVEKKDNKNNKIEAKRLADRGIYQ